MNKKLREAREQSGMTQAQVAKAVGINLYSYQRYESEKRIPNARKAIRVANVLNSTVEELFGSGPPKIYEPSEEDLEFLRNRESHPFMTAP